MRKDLPYTVELSWITLGKPYTWSPSTCKAYLACPPTVHDDGNSHRSIVWLRRITHVKHMWCSNLNFEGTVNGIKYGRVQGIITYDVELLGKNGWQLGIELIANFFFLEKGTGVTISEPFTQTCRHIFYNIHKFDHYFKFCQKLLLLFFNVPK